MSVTIVSCIYGSGYDRFVSEWNHYVKQLDPAPDRVIVFADRHYEIPCAHVHVTNCPWEHPQAFYLQHAIEHAQTEWVWILDIDDTAMPDALAGLDDVEADVWMTGYERSDGETYIPPDLTAVDVLRSPRNLITGASAIRTGAFHDCGGFRDVALQDWALWRALAENGATFESSGRANYRYLRHPATRGETELTVDRRPEHLAEMTSAEGANLAVR